MSNAKENGLFLSSRNKIHPILRNIFIPIGIVVIIVVLKLEFISALGLETPLLLLYIPVIVSAGIGGITAGVVATVLSSAVAIYFLNYPSQILILHPNIILQVSTFFFEGLIISTIIEALHVARNQARKAYVDLQASQERYRLIVENATGYAIFMISTKGKVLSWNPGAEKLLGYSAKEIIGKSFTKFYTPEEKKSNLPKKELQEAKEKGKANDDNWIAKKDGSRFWGSGITMPIINKRNALVGFEKIIRDGTHEKLLQEKRDDFISIATHELRTPVTSMNAYFSVLQKRLIKEKNYGSLELFAKVNNQLKKLTTLIQDLLDVSRIQNNKFSLNKENIVVDDIVKETVEDMRQAASAFAITLQGNTHANIYADKSRISEVISNLISNAIKYSPKEKKIIVSLEKKKHVVQIGVRDFGVGIKKKDQKKIFDRFYRTQTNGNDQSGLGLGLYIAREIIYQHHGTIGVKSMPGKGAFFFIRLPLSQTTKRKTT